MCKSSKDNFKGPPRYLLLAFYVLEKFSSYLATISAEKNFLRCVANVVFVFLVTLWQYWVLELRKGYIACFLAL